MSIDVATKLNQLLSSWPDGQVKSAKWLNAHGYGSELLQRYKKSRWIEPLGIGAYKKSGDQIDWFGGLACLQNELDLDVHVGGKTALELLGKSQYIPVNQKNIVLLGNRKDALPLWFKKINEKVLLKYKVKKLFKNDAFGDKKFGFTKQEFGKNIVVVSSSERAFLEYLDELPKQYSYQEALDILENLPSLRSSPLQFLLENCKSIKVKRLFLHLSEKVHHPWFDKLDKNHIELGKGKRFVFSEGILDKKYQITIPKGI